eukprot:7798671-Alexandrium_andersonii.AAC.1
MVPTLVEPTLPTSKATPIAASTMTPSEDNCNDYRNNRNIINTADAASDADDVDEHDHGNDKTLHNHGIRQTINES